MMITNKRYPNARKIRPASESEWFIRTGEFREPRKGEFYPVRRDPGGV